MRIVKTQKILYNHELRIRLIADNDDAEYIRLVRKLPDCRWSNHLNSWHTNNIQNHIFYLNKIFSSYIRFYDVSDSPVITKVDEKLSDRRICVQKNFEDKSLVFKFLYDHELEEVIQKSGGLPLPGNGKAWIISNTLEIAGNLNSYLKKANYQIDFECVREEDKSSELQTPSKVLADGKFREFLVSMNYENRTIEQYITNVKRFLLSIQQNRDLSTDRIQDYIDEMSISKNFSRSYLNQIINSIKAYYRYSKGCEIGRFELNRPRRDFSNPVILTKHEVSSIIKLIPNIKHNTLISTIYMTGITVSETVSIKPEDINYERMEIFIRGRKRKAGRTIPFSSDLLQKIEIYRNYYHPQNFLFEGYHGTRYSERSIQKVLKKYVQKAGIVKKTSVKTLRHSFAGHLVSQGVDIKDIQQLLGHTNRRSTEIYRKIVEVTENDL